MKEIIIVNVVCEEIQKRLLEAIKDRGNLPDRCTFIFTYGDQGTYVSGFDIEIDSN